MIELCKGFRSSAAGECGEAGAMSATASFVSGRRAGVAGAQQGVQHKSIPYALVSKHTV